MNVMTHFRLAAIVVATLCLFSCGDGNKPAPLPNLREITEVSVPTGDAQTGSKVAFSLKGSGFETTLQNLYCTFDAAQAEVWIEGNQVASGQKYQLAVNDRTFVIECRPLTAGQVVVELKIEDGGVLTIKKLALNATAKIYGVQLTGIPSPFYEGHRRVVGLNITDPERPNIQNVSYQVGASVVKGKGVIHIAGVDDPVWCDTIPGYEPLTAEVRNSSWQIMYTGMEVGENQLEFTVTDPAKGTSSKSVVSINVDQTDFTITPTVKTQSPINREESFTVHMAIDDKGHQANRFYARTKFLKGQGSILVLSNDIPQTDDPKDLLPIIRSTTCTVWPDTDGEIEAVVEFHDDYGTVREQTIAFSVNSDGYDIAFDAPGELPAFTQKTFEFNIFGSTDELNKYQMSVSLEAGTPDDVRLLLAAKNILGTGFVDVLKHETLYVSFTKAGTYRFKFEFKDKWSEPKERYLTFVVTDNTLSVDMGQERQDVVLGSVSNMAAAWTARLSVPKPEGDLWKGASVKYDLTGKGVLRVNSAVMTPGEIFSLDRHECYMEFAPSTTGTHTLTFLFTLADGRTATKTVYVDAEYSPVKLNLVCPSGTFYDGGSREISILSTQAGYSGNMKYKFEFLAGSGKITGAGGTELTAGATYPVAQNVTERMNYTAEGYTGQVRIRYTVIGGDGMTATGTASFTVEPGLSVNVGVPSSVQMGSPANIEVQASKPGYTGKFKVEYELQKPYPTYVGSGTIAGMTEGVPMEMGNKQTLIFTPTTAGKMQILITVTDDAGKSVSQSKTITIALLPLVVNPSPLRAVLFQPNTITVTIPAGNTPGQYQVSYEPLGITGDPTTKTGAIYFETETMEWNAGVQKTVGTGTYTLTYTPSRQSDHHLRFTLIDANGEITTTTLKITTYLP